jgi:hypothetical protein
MVNFENAKVYRIVCNVTGQQYIGSTTQTLAQRLSAHTRAYKSWVSGTRKQPVTSFDILKNGNYDIVLIEEYPCKNTEQLHARERHFIETMPCLNKYVPTRTREEYRHSHKEQNAKAWANYYKIHREEIIRRQLQRFDCECGHSYTKAHKTQHKRSKVHKAWIEQQSMLAPEESQHSS